MRIPHHTALVRLCASLALANEYQREHSNKYKKAPSPKRIDQRKL
jgi:hypothetical protein